MQVERKKIRDHKLLLSVTLTIAAILLLAPAFLWAAADVAFTFRILDPNGNPVDGALVQVKELGVEVWSDEKGIVVLDVAPGRYTLEVFAAGYRPIVKEVDLHEAMETPMDIRFAVGLQEVVVTGTRTDRILQDAPVKTELIGIEDIKAAGAKNLYEVLDKGLCPGVWVETSCTNCNFSSVRMQGLESGYTLILLDGLPVFSSLAGVYGLRQILPENIERIEVIKGASSALYGSSALGGVINIILKEPSKDKPKLNLNASCGDYNTFDIAGTASMRMGNLAGIITAQKHLNGYVDENGDGFTDKIEQDNHFLGLKTHYYLLDDMHRITLLGRSLRESRKGGYIPGGRPIEDEEGHIIGYTRGIDDAMDPDAEHINTDRWEYGLGYRAAFRRGNLLDINMITTKHERDATNGERPFHSKERIYFVDLLYSHPILEGMMVFTGGVNFKDETLDQTINWSPQAEANSQTWGIFVQDEIFLHEKFDFVLGCRFDDVDSTLVSDSAVSPRVSLRWRPLENLTVRGAFGGGYRVPFLFAEDLHLCSAAPVVTVDPGIKPERSWSYSIGAEYRSDRILCDLSIFRTDIRDKIFLDYDESLNMGIYVNGTNAYTQGVEANTTISLLKNLACTLSFTYIDAQFKDELDPDFPWSEYIMRVPEITARLGLDYEEPWLGVKINIGGRLVGSMYLEREMIIEGQEEFEYHIDRTDPYTIWDTRVTKSFSGDRYSVFFGVDNIFDEVQETIYNADQEASAAYIYAPLTGRYIYGGVSVKF